MNAAPFQYAIAEGLDENDDYLIEAARVLQGKRDLLAGGLEAAGFTVFPSLGTFFITTDITPLSDEGGYQFCLDLPNGAEWSRFPVRCSTTTRARDNTSCDGCSRSAARYSKKRWSASGACVSPVARGSPGPTWLFTLFIASTPVALN